ncbi:hypothetical protein Trydic_g11432 [Trypoxylus dichotomus]
MRCDGVPGNSHMFMPRVYRDGPGIVVKQLLINLDRTTTWMTGTRTDENELSKRLAAAPVRPYTCPSLIRKDDWKDIPFD